MKSLFERLRARRLASAFVLLAALSAAIVGGSFAAHGVRGQEKQNDSSDATPLKIVSSPVQPNEFARIAKQVAPAVVNINTQTLPKQSTNRNLRNRNRSQQNNGNGNNDEENGQQGDNDNDLQQFFNRFFGGQNPFSGGGTDNGNEIQESLGSGFIVDSKGYIVTNYHVVEKADKIYVKLSTDPDNDNGRPAHVIGTDKSTDLAVIKIDTDKPLPTVKLGDSDGVQVGDWVEAIGSPFALSQTVTAGIISAKNRTIEPGTSGQFQHFLQTDAAINPGNSGGPLVDMNGNVIGVNTAIYTQSNGYQGVGFALPSNTIASVYNQLIGASHKVVRGSIGIQFQSTLSDAVNRVYGFKNGVLVQKVQPSGPAGKAGLKPGDIITSIDGRDIKDGDDLVNEIANRKPDSTVRLGYLRDGKPAETTVTIGDRDKVFAETASNQGSNAPESGTEAGESKLGIVVRDLPSSVASKIQSSGVLIESVRSGSFADLQGLEPGLVITHLNRQTTNSREQFNTAAGKLKAGSDVVLEVIDPNNLDQGVNYVAGTLQ